MATAVRIWPRKAVSLGLSDGLKRSSLLAARAAAPFLSPAPRSQGPIALLPRCSSRPITTHSRDARASIPESDEASSSQLAGRSSRLSSTTLSLLLLAALSSITAYQLSEPTTRIQNEESKRPQEQLPPKAVRPKAAEDPSGKMISMEEIEKHNSKEAGIWVVISGEVYDLTDWIDSHPGGANVILNNAGKDVTEIYKPVHPADAIEQNLRPDQFLGHVDPATVTVVQKTETETEKRRRIARENLPPVGAILNLDDFERKAKEILSDQAWAYYSSAADDTVTLHENRSAYSRIFFKPRILRSVGQVDPSTTMLGGTIESSLPIYISPAAMAKLGHPEGELNLTRAAGEHGVVQGVSANASVSLDEILSARQPGQPLFYQLYVNKDRAASERILKKIEDAGVTAVLLTVDAPVMGKRELDMRSKGEVVETGGGSGGQTQGKGVGEAISGYIDPNLTWEDIKWYKSQCKLPLFLKGVQSVEDAQLAVKHGVQGIILSNHGGRSLDYSRPPLDVLVELRQQSPELFDKTEVYIDGGIRRGTDVIKALALGATAVGLGRPFLYAQSGFGQPGADRAIAIMRDEIERCMRLLGVTRLDQLGPEYLDVLPRVWASPPPPSLRYGDER